jgi:hypothetical protein
MERSEPFSRNIPGPYAHTEFKDVTVFRVPGVQRMLEPIVEPTIIHVRALRPDVCAISTDLVCRSIFQRAFASPDAYYMHAWLKCSNDLVADEMY